MTRERFEQIKTAAMQMVDEIEFADFVDVNLLAVLEWHNLFHRLVHDPNYLALVRGHLRGMFEVCEQQYQPLPDGEQIDHQAAALVQYAMRGAVLATFEGAAAMVRYSLRTKFKRLAEPVILAPGDLRAARGDA